jgi:hypothetical protein
MAKMAILLSGVGDDFFARETPVSIDVGAGGVFGSLFDRLWWWR